jgi:phage repressor protein C with HTH and peptisase S24 domain
VGSAEVGKYIRQGQALRERRENLPDSNPKERSQRNFSIRLGISQSFLSRLENGHEPIPGYGLEWYEGKAAAYKWTTDEMLQALGIEYAKSIRTTMNTEEKALGGYVSSTENWLMMPVRDIAAAGNGLPNSEDSYDYGMIAVPRAAMRNGIEAVRITGDSMTAGNPETDIKDGDVVLLDTKDTVIKDSRVYVVQIDGIGAVVKRVRFYGTPIDSMMLVSDNTKYAPFAPDEARVVGRVFEIVPKRRGI